MDDLYLESFFDSKIAPSKKTVMVEEISDTSQQPHSSKAEHQIHSFFLLLKQELSKSFQDSTPIQALIRKIEESIDALDHLEVMSLLEQLEELIDMYTTYQK